MNNLSIGFVGLGKLGLPCAEEIAKKHTVYGYDIAPRTSKLVNVQDTIQDVVKQSDIIFVAVQTPHDQRYDGRAPSMHLEPKDFDYTVAKECLNEINKYATKDQLVVLISTVLPGTTRRELRSCINNARFIYNPYLIAMGSVAWDMVNPEMVIIGTRDGTETGDAELLIELYKTIMQNDPRYIVGTWDEAESIKIFYNTLISAKVGLVNMIQDVAIANGNIDVDIVTDALKESDMRITGTKYMTPGMGDAGPCHPRDNIALRWLAEKLDLGYDMFYSIMGAREEQAKRMAMMLVKEADATGFDVYIHGKAYKPEVDFIDGSYSLLVGHYVEEAGQIVHYVDPLTEETVPDSIKGVVLLAHNRSITYDYTGQTGPQDLYCKIQGGSVVIDPWRSFCTDDDVKVIHYGNTRNSV